MSILSVLLTFVLVFAALFLILLVLVQLPKKEAGVGMAFGAGMSEMLLGAGSGNVLTRITKYTVGIYLGLALLLSILVASEARRSGQGISRAIEERARSAAPTKTVPPPTTPGAFQPLSSTSIITQPSAAPEGATNPLLLNPTPSAEPAPGSVAVPVPTATPPPAASNRPSTN